MLSIMSEILPQSRTADNRGAIVPVNAKTKASKALLTDAIRRYALVLTALFRPTAKTRKGVAEEREAAFERAKESIRERIVMDIEEPDCPVLIRGNFEWVPGRHNPKHGRIQARFMLGTHEVVGVPAVSVGIDYLELDGEERWVSAGDFLFFVIRPEEGGDKNEEAPEKYHIVFPVGLCSPRVLKGMQGLYSNLADDETRKLYLPIGNSLDKVGMRKMEFRASCYEPSKKNKEQFVIGHYMGKIMLTEVGSYRPTPNRDGDGYEIDVWRYTEGPSVILVKWQGRLGAVSTDDRVTVLEVSYELDGFKTLGKELHELSPRTVDARCDEIRDMPLDETNPALAAVVEIGLIGWNDDFDRQVDYVSEALEIAARKVKDELGVIWNKLIACFSPVDFDKLAREALKDADLEELKKATGGEDALTKFIAERLEGEFDWRLPIMVELRAHLGRQVEEARNNIPPAAAPPAPEATRPVMKTSVSGVQMELDCFELLGIQSQLPDDLRVELETMPEPDQEVFLHVAVVLEPLLKAKSKKALDPAVAKDLKRLRDLIGRAKRHVLDEVVKASA